VYKDCGYTIMITTVHWLKCIMMVQGPPCWWNYVYQLAAHHCLLRPS